MAFFGARAAFVAGGLDWMIGVVPVVEGAVLAVLLRSLLDSSRQGSAIWGDSRSSPVPRSLSSRSRFRCS